MILNRSPITCLHLFFLCLIVFVTWLAFHFCFYFGHWIKIPYVIMIFAHLQMMSFFFSFFAHICYTYVILLIWKNDITIRNTFQRTIGFFSQFLLCMFVLPFSLIFSSSSNESSGGGPSVMAVFNFNPTFAKLLSFIEWLFFIIYSIISI